MSKPFLNSELTVYICDGMDQEKLDWVQVINTAGEMLGNQEILNTLYHSLLVVECYFQSSERVLA